MWPSGVRNSIGMVCYWWKCLMNCCTEIEYLQSAVPCEIARRNSRSISRSSRSTSARNFVTWDFANTKFAKSGYTSRRVSSRSFLHELQIAKFASECSLVRAKFVSDIQLENRFRKPAMKHVCAGTQVHRPAAMDYLTAVIVWRVYSVSHNVL